MKPFSAIPTPKGLPFIGNALDFQRAFSQKKLHEQLFKWYQELGPVYRIKIANMDMVVVTHPESIESIVRKAMENGGRRLLTELSDTILESHGLPVMIVTDDYDKWKRYRPLSNILLQPALVNQLAPRISTIANDWNHKLREVAQQQPDGSFVVPKLRQFVNLFTLETIVAVTQGKRLGLTVPGNIASADIHKFTKNVEDAISMVTDSTLNFPFWKYFKTPFYRAFEKTLLFINDFSRKIRNNTATADLQVIEDGKQSLGEVYTALGKKNGLSDDEILQVDIDSAIAGVDTTSGAITVMMFELALHPEYQEEIYKDVCSAMDLDPLKPEASLPPIDNSRLKKMGFLKNFVKDAIRKSPIAPMNARRIFEDFAVHDYIIPKNTDIMLFNYGVNRDEKYFDNPHLVDPHRFDKDDVKINEYTMQMFGLGERACPGRRIAMAEIYIMVANLVYQYRLKTNAKDYELSGTGLIAPLVTDENNIHFMPRK